MDKNKVRYGFSNVHIAYEAADSTDSNPKWDTPVSIPGVVSFSPKANSSEYKFYADNGVYYATYSDTGYTGDLTMAKFSDEFLVNTQGWELDAKGGLVEVQNGVKRKFALMGQVEGDIEPRRFVYYSCNASKPSPEYSTSAENIEVKTETISLTTSQIKIGDKSVSRYVITRSDTNADVFDKFFDTVYLPTLGQAAEETETEE